MIKKTLLLAAFIAISNYSIGQVVLKQNHCTCDTLALRKRYEKYLHKEVYKFLLDDSIRKYERIRPGQEPPGILCCLDVSLNKNAYITVGFEPIKYQVADKGDGKWEWDIPLIYKETIRRIIFYFPDELNSFVLE